LSRKYKEIYNKSIVNKEEFWKNISLVNPLMYMINAFRHGMLGTSDLETLGFSVNFAIFMMIVFITIIYSIALWMLNSGRGIRS